MFLETRSVQDYHSSLSNTGKYMRACFIVASYNAPLHRYASCQSHTRSKNKESGEKNRRFGNVRFPLITSLILERKKRGHMLAYLGEFDVVLEIWNIKASKVYRPKNDEIGIGKPSFWPSRSGTFRSNWYLTWWIMNGTCWSPKRTSKILGLSPLSDAVKRSSAVMYKARRKTDPSSSNIRDGTPHIRQDASIVRLFYTGTA